MGNLNFAIIDSKSRFEEMLNRGEIQETLVVFIKDTQQIWTHGLYFGNTGGGNFDDVINRISNLENNLKEIKEECFSNDIEIKKQLLIKNSEIYPLEKEELIFDNSYGGFKNNGKEYFIYKNQDNKLPAVWCNILANKLFGCKVTDNLGGYCWSKNSRMNRITAWNNDSVLDIPSELIYIKDEDTILVAREIVKKIENELEYPGQIKINLIRESRATDYAK